MSVKFDGTAARGAMNDLVGGMQRTQMFTARQQRLNSLYSFFRCDHYSTCTVSWDGSAVQPDDMSAQISIQGYTPPGFENVTEQTLPLRYRKPTAPYHLGRVIVERFTSLLFSQRRHPKIDVPGDQETEDFLEAVAEVGSLWARLIVARNYGGSMGSVGLGFKLLNGVPVFEVFDPRFSTPEFTDPIDQEVERFVFEFPFSEFSYNKKGEQIEHRYFYRREVDAVSDRIWRKLPEDQNPEEVPPSVAVQHNLGFCPVVWIQNQEVQGEIDGDCDLHGCHEMIRAMDALISQANRGILANCDPTLLVVSEDDLSDIQKGSGVAIKLNNGTAQYMEINGQGPRSALELADRFEKLICRTARVVLDQSSSVTKTATEIDRDYSSMLEKADVLREQYGERGVKKLLRIVLRVCKAALVPRRLPDGTLGVPRLALPPKVITDPKTGAVSFQERKMGGSDVINLQWGPYFQPTLDDANKAVQAATLAKEKGVVGPEAAVRFVAPYFGIQDVPAELHKITTAQEEELKKLQDMAAQQMAQEGGGGEAPAGEEPEAGADEGEVDDEEPDDLQDEEDMTELENDLGDEEP